MSALDDVLHNYEVYKLLPASVEDARAELAKLRTDNINLQVQVMDLDDFCNHLRADNVELSQALYETHEHILSDNSPCWCLMYRKENDPRFGHGITCQGRRDLLQHHNHRDNRK